jgi:hypothetical protein
MGTAASCSRTRVGWERSSLQRTLQVTTQGSAARQSRGPPIGGRSGAPSGGRGGGRRSQSGPKSW